MKPFKLSLFFVTSILVSACGSDKTSPAPAVSPSPTPLIKDISWSKGEFLDQSFFKDYCQTPRIGIDSYTGQSYPDKKGSSLQEKLWLRSWSDDTYLWYREIFDNDPEGFSTVIGYFDQLKTIQLTESGASKDNFHFHEATEAFNKKSQSGVVSGYGIQWAFINNTPPRKLQVAFVEANSPADRAGIERGYELNKINEVDFINTRLPSDIEKINQAIFPLERGDTNSFTFADNSDGENDPIEINLTSEDLEINPVQKVSTIEYNTNKIGYMQFNAFISVAQDDLVSAFEQFRNDNISDLVIDLRYNGGGLLAMSSQLAYMVAGSGATNNLIFEQSQYNDKTRAARPLPFIDSEINWTEGYLDSGKGLPSVNLSRVFILTTSRTCSASEALINGLRGIDIEVIQIGDSTCGKPYGFLPVDNCGTTYYTIQFKGVNHKGFGEYSNGFSPTETPFFANEVKGCMLADDFTHQLGDENEALLAAALDYTETGECPVAAAAKPSRVKYVEGDESLAIDSPDTRLESFFFENKIYQALPINK